MKTKEQVIGLTSKQTQLLSRLRAQSYDLMDREATPFTYVNQVYKEPVLGELWHLHSVGIYGNRTLIDAYDTEGNYKYQIQGFGTANPTLIEDLTLKG